MLKNDTLRIGNSAYDPIQHMEECRNRGLAGSPRRVGRLAEERVRLLSKEEVRLEGIDLVRATQGKGHVLWTSADIKRRAINGFCIVLQEGGICTVEQGSSVRLEPGDMMLVDTAREAHYQLEEESRQLWASIPRSKLEGVGLDWRKYSGKPVPPAASAVLPDLIGSAFRGADKLGNCAKAALETSFVNVFIAMYADLSACANQDGPFGLKQEALQNILDFLSENLDDPDLAPAAIAGQFAMSERQLHRIFQAHDLTVCGWIRNARLQRCAMELRDPSSLRRSVTEIAFSNGFNDCAHFSRLFKDSFECSPRAYRRQAQFEASVARSEIH